MHEHPRFVNRRCKKNSNRSHPLISSVFHNQNPDRILRIVPVKHIECIGDISSDIDIGGQKRASRKRRAVGDGNRIVSGCQTSEAGHLAVIHIAEGNRAAVQGDVDAAVRIGSVAYTEASCIHSAVAVHIRDLH